MANHMLGGGALRSRLADRIRQKEGLSYGVGSQLSIPARDPAGLWLAYAISAPQNTQKVEAALREEIDVALKSGFTDAELVEAKKGWLQGEEVYRTEDNPLAQRLSAYLEIDRTMAYDKDLEAKIAALTVAQVNEALRQHLKPANLSVISAGDFAKVQVQVLEQHDGLAVHDLAARHHGQGLVGIEFEHLDVLAFLFQPAALAHLRGSVVLADEEMQPLRDRTGTHEDVEDLRRCLMRRPVSSSSSARMRCSGLALSSRPAAASIRKPSCPLT
jgi:hypothetical protein